MGVTFAENNNNSYKLDDECRKHATLASVHNKIKNAIAARQTRTNEYLKDFDRLRTGFITTAQFDRCLDQHYGVVLDPAENFILVKRYGDDPRHPGMINYREFCKAVGDEENDNDESLTRVMTTRPLSSTSLMRCSDLLHQIVPYYKYHGINIKSSYADFDQHNIGLITDSQFYRQFPGPPDISEKDQMLLARKYAHPTKQGLVNYLDFHQDMENIMQDQSNDNENLVQEPVKYFLDQSAQQGGSPTELIFNKIREAVHKNGIRTTEFFKDHDKLRSGIITKNQFVCGLSLCCGTQANLSREEIDSIVNHYQTEDGRVRYREFCHLMENAFNVPHLEKNPTVDVIRPPMGALAKFPNVLSDNEEKEVARIISELRETVQKKRIMPYPYFKDFDRGFGNTRGITRTQFSRMLHMMGLHIQLNDLAILCQKFEYPTSGDINYPAFIQAIDTEYCGRAPVTGGWNTTIVDKKDGQLADETPDISSVDVDELIKRIRHHVLVNRIRVEEFFQDFDPLRHGSIRTSRFRMGLSAMGQQHLSEAQILAIVNRYADHTRKGNVWWTAFFSDIDKVFTQRGLEKTPRAVLPPAETYHIPKPGSTDWSVAPDDKKERLDEIMQKMRLKTNQRRILTKPCFQDFDRHNIGYVTRSQLSQCLTYLCLDGSSDDVTLVYEKFSDATGFNYLKFLEELQPSGEQEHKYLKRIEELKLVNKDRGEEVVPKDISDVMNKIKTKVVKEAVRVYEFMKDYDKLRTGRMLKTIFPRALDLCALGLTPSEINTVKEWYSSPGHDGYVDYYRFCDDVESCFTQKGLEQNPTLVPTQFKPDPKLNNIKDLPEGEEMLEAVLHRLADRVRIRRIQLFPLFEDYDRVHNGTVSRSQLHRVLSELELGSLVSAREFHVLYEKFDVVIGGKHDFNYTQFCDTLNNYARFDPNIP